MIVALLILDDDWLCCCLVNSNFIAFNIVRSVAMGYQAIKMGDASVVVCGGQESMSSAPHAVHMRSGTKMGPATLVDTMMVDGLTDAFHNCHMGVTGELHLLVVLAICLYL